MTIASEIEDLQTNLAAAKAAVIAAGGTVGDTGLAGLATEIATIPSGSEILAPRTTYGSALVYTSAYKEYGLNPYDTPEGCTVNSIDQTQLASFLSQYPPEQMGSEVRVNFDYGEDWENPGTYVWRYMYEDPETGFGELKIPDADMTSTTGISVTVDSGADFAFFMLEEVVILDPHSLSWVDVLDASEYEDIIPVGNQSGGGDRIIGGNTYWPEQIKGFAFGTANTTTASFAYCPNFDFVSFEYATSMTSIGDYFLSGCRKFNQAFTIPNSVTSIGNNFLEGAYNFNKPVNIPDTVTSIGAFMLRGDENFNSAINIPSGVTTINNGFLDGCRAFNQPITIPNTVTTIKDWFLEECRSFNQPITIPDTVTSIGMYFLKDCTSFNQPIAIPSTITSINQMFMYGCETFDQPLVIPDTVRNIGAHLLGHCYKFNSQLTLPASVDSMNTYYFLGLCRLFNQPLTLPSGMTQTDNGFMSDCQAFNQPLTIPNTVTSIGQLFMSGCKSFNRPLIIPSTVTRISTFFMKDCSSFNQPFTISSSITAIGESFMKECNSMTSTITCEAPSTVLPTQEYYNSTILSTSTSTAPCYVTGITLAGTYASDWKTTLPDRTTSPYRKLVLAS